MAAGATSARIRDERRDLNRQGVPDNAASQTSRVSGQVWPGTSSVTPDLGGEVMASRKQVSAAKRNVKSAQKAARSKRTISKLPKSVRKDLGRQAAAGRRRGGAPGRALEDRTREQLYEQAKKEGIAGRSRMGKWDLIKALRRSGSR